jgi:endonuclease YncB( thermonuclease family)
MPGPLQAAAWRVLAVLWAVLLPYAAVASSYALTGRVVQVADGDTLTLLVVREQRRIRLASIDAPEAGHGRARPGQPFAESSRRALAALVAGHTLTLHCYEQDHYGRDVCDVPLPDGRSANRVQVASGMAWANRQGNDRYLRDTRLVGLEREARDRRLGLWQQAGAIPPWEWRAKCWRALESGRSTPIC